MTAAVDTLTVLHWLSGRRLAKTIDADGNIEAYPKSKTFDFYEASVGGLEDLYSLLRQLELERYGGYGVIRGAIADPERVCRVRRLLHPDPETKEEPTLLDVPRRWLALDVDGLPRPDWIDVTDLIGCAAVAINHLPSAFQEAAFIVQGTGGHGLKPGIHIRLWCWLCRPVGSAELKQQFRHAPVDPSLFSAGQLIYTAPPTFLPGAYDPLPTRTELVPGRPEVEVEPPKPPARAPTKAARGRRAHSRGNNISGLIRTVESASRGNRNKALYWAACRLAEHPANDGGDAARRLLAAAIGIGLSLIEARKTIESGLGGSIP